MRKFPSFKKLGFTLIELLVVIAIIAILASIVFVNVKSIRQKVKRAAALQSFNQIAKAIDMFRMEGQDFFECGYEYCGLDYEGETNPPPFVPKFYPNWNATYYCSNCQYYLSVWDSDGDGKADCGIILIQGTGVTNTYKNILCEDCPLNCNSSNFN